MSKKIALVSNSSWSIFNYRLGVAKAFLDKGFKVLIVAPQDDFTKNLIEIGCSFRHFEMESKSTNPFNDLKLLQQLKTIYKEEKPNFIFHYTIKPNIWGSRAAKSASIPSIAITTGLGYIFDNNNLVSKIGKWLYKVNLTYSKQIWFLNNEDQKAFLDENIIPKSKAYLIPGEGVNLIQFEPKPKTFEDDKFRFLLLARMLKEKGIVEFVEVARQLKSENVVFQLLGFLDWDAPNAIGKSTMDEWEKEGVIEYLGVSNEVWRLIANCDCVVLPSYYKEGLPRTLMEANAMEKPIITTDNVGCRDVIIDGYNGYMCMPKDVESLKKAMQQMMLLPEKERIEMGKNGRKLMTDKFDEQIIIKEYFTAFEHFTT